MGEHETVFGAALKTLQEFWGTAGGIDREQFW